MKSLSPLEALEKAVELAGSQTELARRIIKSGRYYGEANITQRSVWKWLHSAHKRAPGEYVLGIEAAVEGKIRKEQLRPDIYPRDVCRPFKDYRRRN